MFWLFCDLLRTKNKDMLPGWRSWRHIPSSTDRNRSQTVLVGWWKKHRTLFLQESNSWLHRNVRYKLIKDFPFPKRRRICKCFSRCLLLPQDDDESKIARLSNFGWCHNQSKRSCRECVVNNKTNSKYKRNNFRKSPSRNSWWILVIVQSWQLSYDCNRSCFSLTVGLKDWIVLQLQFGRANKIWGSKSEASFRRITKIVCVVRLAIPTGFWSIPSLCIRPSQCNKGINISNTSYLNSKGVYAQCDKSDLPVLWVVSIQLKSFLYSIRFFQHIHAHPRSQRHPLIPLIESLRLLRYDGHVHWPDCRSFHHGFCGGGEDLGTSREVHLQGRSWRGNKMRFLDYGEFGTWEWKLFVRDRSSTLTSALHSCNNFDMFQRRLGKVETSIAWLKGHGVRSSWKQCTGSRSAGHFAYIWYHLIENCDAKKIQG